MDHVYFFMHRKYFREEKKEKGEIVMVCTLVNYCLNSDKEYAYVTVMYPSQYKSVVGMDVCRLYVNYDRLLGLRQDIPKCIGVDGGIDIEILPGGRNASILSIGA